MRPVPTVIHAKLDSYLAQELLLHQIDIGKTKINSNESRLISDGKTGPNSEARTTTNLSPEYDNLIPCHALKDWPGLFKRA